MTGALAHIPDWMYKFSPPPGISPFHLENEEFPLFPGECMARNPQNSPPSPNGSIWLWWGHDGTVLTSWVPCPWWHQWLCRATTPAQLIPYFFHCLSPSFPHSAYFIASFSGNRNVYKSAFFFFSFFAWLLSKTLSLTRLKNTANKKQKELAFTSATNYYVLPGSEGLLRTQDFYIINDDRWRETLDVRAILSEISLMQLSPH